MPRSRDKPGARSHRGRGRAKPRFDDGTRPDRDAGHKPRLADGSESFKCGHCKTFVGPTVGGGRHRNHCPLCLYSRHVDDARMGDRASGCGSLMAPIGRFLRPKGEEVVLHRCLGCGFERHNRVAADDNALLVLQLPEVEPRLGRPAEKEDGGRRTAEDGSSPERPSS